MGLWSYILPLTLLLKGKQKKSRAASCETARVFHNRTDLRDWRKRRAALAAARLAHR